jgi:type III restriction enzyme
LDAIAVTDHHDLGFFQYIKEAALEETDEQSRPVPAERQIVVFPGMELTLGVPSRAESRGD